MTQSSPLPERPNAESKRHSASTPAYQPPAIIHRGALETRAGSPLINNPFGDPADPNNPLNK
jgi:hypothetical protein